MSNMKGLELKKHSNILTMNYQEIYLQDRSTLELLFQNTRKDIMKIIEDIGKVQIRIRDSEMKKITSEV